MPRSTLGALVNWAELEGFEGWKAEPLEAGRVGQKPGSGQEVEHVAVVDRTHDRTRKFK